VTGPPSETPAPHYGATTALVAAGNLPPFIFTQCFRKAQRGFVDHFSGPGRAVVPI